MTSRAGVEEPDFSEKTANPERSLLFSLPPHGVGTPHQESLRSLLVRTSHAHAINPRLLIRDVFPMADASIARLPTAAFHQRLAGTMNGLGRYAELFVLAMESLTGQRNLHQLTMLPWRDTFPHNGQGLLARHPRWCPVCLGSRNQPGETTAFPLVWSLETYRVCVKHLVALEENCPSCGKVQPFIPHFPDLSICGYCRCPLGGASPSRISSQFTIWVAEAVGEMVAQQSDEGFSPSLETFREFVRQQVTIHTDGNRAAFCRALGLNEFAVSGWLNKGERPSITQFLTLCYGTRTIPTNIFGNSAPPSVKANLCIPLGKLKNRAACPRLTIEQRATLAPILQAQLKSDDARSISSIARELGLGRASLQYWFSNLCKLLSERHLAAAKKRTEQRRLLQCLLIEKIIGNMRAEGNVPSKRSVDTSLRCEGLSLSQPHLMKAFRKLLNRPDDRRSAGTE